MELEHFGANEDEEKDIKYVDDYTLMRHKILSKTYFVKTKDEEEETSKSEEYDLPVLPPPKLDKQIAAVEDEYDTELEYSLRADTPGLLDSDWVEQIREAYKGSQEPIKVKII